MLARVRGARTRCLRAPSRRVERRDLVRQLRLGRLDALEARLGRFHLALRLREARRALALERAQPFLLAPLVAAILLERVLQRDESVAILLDLVAQLLDASDERAVAQREQVQILVACDELAERLGREHRLAS